MYAKEVNEHSPLRILEKSIHGGLGKGNLGAAMARAGVGKTACLVQIGLDDLMRGRGVFHVALGQTLEHVQTWYDALFDDLADHAKLEDREAARTQVVKHRVIKVFADQHLPPDRLERAIDMFAEHLGFKPSVILIDGYDWSGGHSFRDAHTSHIPVAAVSREITAFKALAKKIDAELWISAQTHRGQTGEHPDKLTPPCAPYAQLIDVAIYLESQGDLVQLRILRDHGEAKPSDVQLEAPCRHDALGRRGDAADARPHAAPARRRVHRALRRRRRRGGRVRRLRRGPRRLRDQLLVLRPRHRARARPGQSLRERSHARRCELGLPHRPHAPDLPGDPALPQGAAVDLAPGQLDRRGVRDRDHPERQAP